MSLKFHAARSHKKHGPESHKRKCLIWRRIFLIFCANTKNINSIIRSEKTYHPKKLITLKVNNWQRTVSENGAVYVAPAEHLIIE